MSENNTVSTEVSVKSVISALRDGGATREMSGFDQLSVKDRNVVKKAIRATFDRYMSEGLVGPNNDRIQPLWATLSELDKKSASSASAKVVTIDDVRTKMGEKAAILRYALNMVVSGELSVSGWDGDIPTLSDNEDETDIPEMTDKMVETATKLASVAIGTKTKENDIPTLIHRFMATVATGTFVSVADVRRGIGTTSGIEVNSSWDGRINAFRSVEDKNGQSAADRMEGVENVQFGHPAYTTKNGLIRTDGFEAWESDNTDESDNSDN